jgi:hypothetical protein
VQQAATGHLQTELEICRRQVVRDAADAEAQAAESERRAQDALQLRRAAGAEAATATRVREQAETAAAELVTLIAAQHTGAAPWAWARNVELWRAMIIYLVIMGPSIPGGAGLLQPATAPAAQRRRPPTPPRRDEAAGAWPPLCYTMLCVPTGARGRRLQRSAHGYDRAMIGRGRWAMGKAGWSRSPTKRRWSLTTGPRATPWRCRKRGPSWRASSTTVYARSSRLHDRVHDRVQPAVPHPADVEVQHAREREWEQEQAGAAEEGSPRRAEAPLVPEISPTSRLEALIDEVSYRVSYWSLRLAETRGRGLQPAGRWSWWQPRRTSVGILSRSAATTPSPPASRPKGPLPPNIDAPVSPQQRVLSAPRVL